MEFIFSDTERLVNRCAENVANEVSARSVGEDELWRMVEVESENVAYGYVCNGLQILASYGWSDALYGGVDREDSPLYRFQDDVFERAKELLEDEGIEVYD